MLNAFGAHTYAGGLAYGVSQHFNLIGLGEHAPYGDDIKALNFPDVPLYPNYNLWPRTSSWIREHGAPDGAGVIARGQKVPFLFANPPCAPFSTASSGRSTAWHEDPRLNFFHDIFNMLPAVQPDVMAIESVTQAWKKAPAMIDSLAKDAAIQGYSTTVLLHNARFVGNVQERKRVFFVFHKIAVDWDAPDFDAEPTVGQVLKKVKVPASTKKLYQDQAMLKGLRLKVYEEAKSGARLHSTFDKMFGDDVERNHLGHIIGRPGFLSCKLNPNRPSPVFVGGNHILHPTEPRALYPEEINAIIGFPTDWRWPSGMKLDRISTLASQGVSPHVGAWLAKGVAASIERGKRLNRPQYWVRNELSRDGGISLRSSDPAKMETVPFDLPAMPEPKEPRAPRQNADGAPRMARSGSGAYIRELLLAGKDQTAILKLNKERFPDSKAGPSDVAWNKGKLRASGEMV